MAHAADACISGLLSLAVEKQRGQRLAGGTDVRRSVRRLVGTEQVSGSSAAERNGKPAGR